MQIGHRGSDICILLRSRRNFTFDDERAAETCAVKFFHDFTEFCVALAERRLPAHCRPVDRTATILAVDSEDIFAESVRKIQRFRFIIKQKIRRIKVDSDVVHAEHINAFLDLLIRLRSGFKKEILTVLFRQLAEFAQIVDEVLELRRFLRQKTDVADQMPDAEVSHAPVHLARRGGEAFRADAQFRHADRVERLVGTPVLAGE